VAPDEVLKQIGERFNWDEAKVQSEVQRQGYDPDAPAPETAQAKTPADWVAEVRREQPRWNPEQVAAEARRRAGGEPFEHARQRALELQRQGKSREEIARILRVEGFNVTQ
jgi:hypothetical protein